MKVIAFNGSPNNDGVIQKALELMCSELEHEYINRNSSGRKRKHPWMYRLP